MRTAIRINSSDHIEAHLPVSSDTIRDLLERIASTSSHDQLTIETSDTHGGGKAILVGALGERLLELTLTGALNEQEREVDRAIAREILGGQW